MRGECYPNIAELSEAEVAKQAPFGAKWRLLAQVEVRCYILISNISGSVKVAPLQILQFPVILPHKFQDAEKFNLQFSDFSEITETADKLRWLRYQKGLRQRDVADYAGIYRSTYIHYEEYGKDFYSPKHMEKIAQLFEVPVERLLDDYNLFLRNGQGKQIKAIRMKLGLTQREYDRYFKKALADTCAASQVFSAKSIRTLGNLYLDHEDEFEKLRKHCGRRIEYPAAKILDMCFFEYGYQRDASSQEDSE